MPSDQQTRSLRTTSRRIVEKLSYVATRSLRSEHERRVAEWFANDADESAKYEFDLPDDALVVAVGAYRGQWVSDIYARYLCTVHAYEPVPEFAEALDRRFARNPKIVIHPEGLAGTTRTEDISVQDDASSLFAGAYADRTLAINLRSAREALDDLGSGPIDLMMVNIEGAEYELLDSLLGDGYTARIRNLLIQFHDFVPDAGARRNAIRDALRATHRETFCTPFVWEGWRKLA
jgi:FkbM family methyltransferase